MAGAAFEDVLRSPVGHFPERLRSDEVAKRLLARPGGDDQVLARGFADLAEQVRVAMPIDPAHRLDHARACVLEDLLLAGPDAVVHADRHHLPHSFCFSSDFVRLRLTARGSAALLARLGTALASPPMIAAR